MPFRLPANQTEALKDARKIRDLLRRFEARHHDLFLPFERVRLSATVDTMTALVTALRTPPGAEDQYTR
jgi:hypothetical protein